jgi:nucleoside-diphosphate-sugar epimerase
MRIVVTGGVGKLGQYAIRELLDHGHEVTSADIVASPGNNCRSLIVDLTNTADICAAVKDADGVIHLARKPFPYTYTEEAFDPRSRTWKIPDTPADTELFNYNVAITHNVLAASNYVGVKRLVVGSSLAIYGFYYPLCRSVPEYLPVDENHPLKPQDPYSVSKIVCEEICNSFVRKSDMRVASLRFAGITTDLSHQGLLERRENPLRWTGALWTFIDVRDAAVACRLSLEADLDGHQAFNICAPTTIMDSSTYGLIREYLPEVTRINGNDEGNWSGYDPGKAANLLGFNAKYLLANG